MAPTKLVLPYGRIPPKWDPNTAREINEDFQDLVNFVNALKAQVDNITILTPAGTRGAEGRPGFDGLDGRDGEDSLIPGPRGATGPQGPTDPAGSGGGGGQSMPYHEEYAPDDSPDLFPPLGTPGPQGPIGATGPTGPTGPAGPAGGGGGMNMPYFPDSFIPDDSPDLLPIPGMAFASSIAAQAATVSWGTPSGLTLDADFTFSSDGVVVLYNTISQGGTFKINGSVIGGVATNQSSTCSFPYSSGQTGHVVSGLSGSGLTATFYPFTGGCGWGAPVSLTVGSSFTKTAHGLVLIYNSNNQSMTFTMGGVNYAELFTDLNESVGVPYIAGSSAVVTGGGGTGLTANYYPFTGNGAWTAPVSLSLNTNFTETASGMIVGYNSGNQGATLFENGLNIGGVFNSNHHSGNFPHTVSQTANLTTVGGSGFLAWFFALPTAGGGSTIITGGNVNSNLSSATIGTPAVFADTSGKLITSTLNRLIQTGTGNPQGVLAAALGTWYVDTATGLAYLKRAGGSTAYGWYVVRGDAWSNTDGFVIRTGAASGNLLTSGIGIAVANGSFSTLADDNTTDNMYIAATGPATINTFTGMLSPNTTDGGGLHDSLDFEIIWQIRTGATLTTIRHWFAVLSLSGSQPPPNSDTLSSTSTVRGMAFRYSTVASDPGWVGVGWDGTTQTVTGNLANVAASTSYKLRLRKVGTSLFFSVNDGTESTLTAAAGSNKRLQPTFGIYNTAASARAFSFNRMVVWFGS